MGDNNIPLGQDSRIFTLQKLTDLVGYKTTMTLRRWIYSGKLKAEKVPPGDHGSEEYRIKEVDVPKELLDRAAAKRAGDTPEPEGLDVALQLVQRIEDNYKLQLREQQDTIMQLSAKLGAAREREQALQVKIDEQTRFLQGPAVFSASGKARSLWERVKELFR